MLLSHPCRLKLILILEKLKMKKIIQFTLNSYFLLKMECSCKRFLWKNVAGKSEKQVYKYLKVLFKGWNEVFVFCYFQPLPFTMLLWDHVKSALTGVVWWGSCKNKTKPLFNRKYFNYFKFVGQIDKSIVVVSCSLWLHHNSCTVSSVIKKENNVLAE